MTRNIFKKSTTLNSRETKIFLAFVCWWSIPGKQKHFKIPKQIWRQKIHTNSKIKDIDKKYLKKQKHFWDLYAKWKIENDTVCIHTPEIPTLTWRQKIHTNSKMKNIDKNVFKMSKKVKKNGFPELDSDMKYSLNSAR